MPEIKSPAQASTYPDRHLVCQKALEAGLLELLYAAVSAGWDIDEPRRRWSRLLITK